MRRRLEICLMIFLLIIFIPLIIGNIYRMYNFDNEIEENQKYCPEGYKAGMTKLKYFPLKYNEECRCIPMIIECFKVIMEEGHYNKDVIIVDKN